MERAGQGTQADLGCELQAACNQRLGWEAVHKRQQAAAAAAAAGRPQLLCLETPPCTPGKACAPTSPPTHLRECAACHRPL
jgi:hypothetical protein